MIDRLPILVYGTLRPGDYNYNALIKDLPHKHMTVTLEGYQLWAAPSFPYVMVGEGSIVCDLIYFGDAIYEEALENLDWLEGYRGPNSPGNHYERIIANVHTDSGEIQAYIYVAAEQVIDHALTLTYVTHGDWMAWKNENKTSGTEVVYSDYETDEESEFFEDDMDDDFYDALEMVSADTINSADIAVNQSVKESKFEPIFED